MLGAIIGDIIGSVYEFHRPPIKSTDFELFTDKSTFTDDTVLTVAVAEAILTGAEYGPVMQRYARAYPGRGYGGNFRRWIHTDPITPYGSYGNGSAMRVSPVGFAFDSIDSVLAEAERSALPSHNHPEGVKGAQATALMIFEARYGMNKAALKTEIEARFGYNLERTLDEIRPGYYFNETCQGSVPEAILAFTESHDFEETIRLAISLGGDADTLAAIAGGMAQAYYGELPPALVQQARLRLPDAMLRVIDEFHERYCARLPQ
jgi:ADP-ribosylglycohydrolase